LLKPGPVWASQQRLFSVQWLHALEETREMKVLWTGSREVADRRDLACPWWYNFRAGRIA